MTFRGGGGGFLLFSYHVRRSRDLHCISGARLFSCLPSFSVLITAGFYRRPNLFIKKSSRRCRQDFDLVWAFSHPLFGHEGHTDCVIPPPDHPSHDCVTFSVACLSNCHHYFLTLLFTCTTYVLLVKAICRFRICMWIFFRCCNRLTD